MTSRATVIKGWSSTQGKLSSMSQHIRPLQWGQLCLRRWTRPLDLIRAFASYNTNNIATYTKNSVCGLVDSTMIDTFLLERGK
jgi:hypothetical protein